MDRVGKGGRNGNAARPNPWRDAGREAEAVAVKMVSAEEEVGEVEVGA